MKRLVRFRESEPKTLVLTEVEADAVRRLGKALRGKQASWLTTNDDESERSAISCVPTSGGDWRVEVSNCVGVIRVGDTQMEVEPKIPLDHLVFLMEAGGAAPRSTLDGSPGASKSVHLWDLVAEWFVNAAEQLLRRGLLKDYRPTVDEVETIQGSPQPLETAQLFYRGVLGAVCEFDEFDEDSSLNRVVATAARAVASNPLLDIDLRRRAMRVYSRFDLTTALRPADLLVQVDRRSHYYKEPLTFAKHVLASVGRLPTSGEHTAWSFLIPTPNMVESGLRGLLAEHLPHRRVKKKSLPLGDSEMTVNPDLVIDSDLVVGDIKYKTNIDEWSRSDLYQTVAFATAYGAAAGIVIGFGNEESAPLPTPVFGDLPVRFVRWCAAESVTPAAAATSLAAMVEEWLVEAEHRASLALDAS